MKHALAVATIAIVAAVCAAADEVSFGYTGSTASDQFLGIRMDWTGNPGIAGQFTAGDRGGSVMAGPTVALGSRLAVYALAGGAKTGGAPSRYVCQPGASWAVLGIRINVGYHSSPGGHGRVAFGVAGLIARR